MKNRKVSIAEQAAYPFAEERFIQTCGFNLETEKHQRMMKMGAKVREEGLDGINVNGIVSFYGPECFVDDKIAIDGIELTCNYFAQIPQKAVKGVYLYMLTAGECHFSSEENIMDFLYADIWGTNYVDAGVHVLTEEFIKKDMVSRFDGDAYLSEQFGPGYFGMPVIETKKFFQVMDADTIGVWVKDSGLMIPQKSCAGLYLVYDRDDIKAELSCMKCYGNAKGCQFCAVRNTKDEVNA